MLQEDLSSLLDRLDALVDQCISGVISGPDFKQEYGYPVGEYALDGHEGDDEYRALLASEAGRIAFHILVMREILHNLCSSNDANLESYRTAGFFGPEQIRPKLISLRKANDVSHET